tara:strand:+ start:317 stop:550 length:234 start_codon:yes stop_codon:yes gene_type:complete
MNIFINVLRILHPMKNAVNFYKYLTNFIKCDMGWERTGTGHDNLHYHIAKALPGKYANKNRGAPKGVALMKETTSNI